MSVGFNANKFIKDSKECTEHSISEVTEVVPVKSTTTKKRGRKKKKDENLPAEVTSSTEPIVAQNSMSYVQSNIPYINAYMDTNQQLDDAINQLDMLSTEVVNQLATVRNSKTLKNKYNYINDYSQTISGIIGNKISAIKEKNKTINDVNNLELRRLKELKTNTSEEDDNTRISNLYDAFINTPIGGQQMGTSILGPSMADITMAGGSGLPVMNSNVNYADDQSSWEQNLDPVQNKMLLEAKGLIETVVVYDETSGNRWFDVLDKQTGQSVPNVERPDDTYIYNLDINVKGGYAKDTNINKSYPLIVVNNGDTSITNY